MTFHDSNEMKLRGIHSHMILTNINSFLTQHFTNKGWEMKFQITPCKVLPHISQDNGIITQKNMLC